MAQARFSAAVVLASLALAFFATVPGTRVAFAEPDLSLNLIQHGPVPALDGEVYASYTVTLQNVGTTDTTGPLTVTFNLPAGMTFIYVDSFPSDWGCVDGVDLVCTETEVIPAPPAIGGSDFVILVRLESGIAASVMVTATAETAGELETANNSETATLSTDADRAPACGYEAELETLVEAGGASGLSATTSTTSGTTQTVDDDGVVIEQYETRVTATLDGEVIFDETVDDEPDSAAAQDLIEEAEAALEAGDASASDPETLESMRTLVDSDGTPTVVFDHTETSITVQTTFGPATILVGEEQSITCFIAAGLLNVNTHTHTQTFEILSAGGTETYLNFVHLGLEGEAETEVARDRDVTPARNLGPVLAGVLIGPGRPADPPVSVAAAGTTIRPPSTGDAGLLPSD